MVDGTLVFQISRSRYVELIIGSWGTVGGGGCLKERGLKEERENKSISVLTVERMRACLCATHGLQNAIQESATDILKEWCMLNTI